MVAAFRNLQIAVVARRQLQPGVGDQVDIGRQVRRRRLMHRLDHLFVLMRAGDGEHLREAGADHLRLFAHTARHDHAAVFRDRFADRLKAFFLGGIEETAGVDQHDVGAGIIGGHLIAVGAQLGEDAFAVDQILGTAERHHADARRRRKTSCHESARHSRFRALLPDGAAGAAIRRIRGRCRSTACRVAATSNRRE